MGLQLILLPFLLTTGMQASKLSREQHTVLEEDAEDENEMPVIAALPIIATIEDNAI
eukprot:NODE_6876_length_273_cov_251.718750_g6264_i0.p2 GENE.NODE_6876_length_273_cov_251.718750_g6264_i0~~NODE_6876_length_273_cov_251.718750_g6264_i0.p2  ORF type:complete len:57 (+),score=11.17 NODE_6876_length_273_cov_251.718750_g6264_i0:33-203(+)